jgi:hypothetical protein
MSFTCTTCGAEHDLDSITLGADAPDQWGMLSDEERSRSELGGDQCVIETADGTHYFIRACLEIPIVGRDDPARTKLGPYFGWLCTRVPEYPETMFMKTHVHQRAVGMRPLVELETSDHLLSVHQRDGIPEQDMRQILSRVLHER